MATNDIRQRIGLDGADDVKKQLNDVGDAGQAAFKKVNDAAGNSDSLQKFGPELDSLGASARALGASFAEVGQAFLGFIENAAKVGAAVAGAAVGFSALVISTAKAEAALQQMSQAIGLTVDQFRGLQFAFQENGVGQDQFVSGMSRFNAAVAKAGEQQTQFADAQEALNQKLFNGQIGQRQYNDQLAALNTQAAKSTNVFQQLNIAIAHNADGTVDANQTLRNVADTFAALPSGAEKSAAALQLFGRGNAAFVATLNQGSAGLDAYNAELLRIAPPLSETAELAGGKLAQAWAKLEAAFDSLKNSAIAPFFAPLTQIIDDFTASLVANRPAIIDAANQISAALVPAAQILGNVFTGVVVPAFQLFYNFFFEVGVLIGDGIRIFNQLSDAVQVVANSITGFFSGLGDNASAAVTAVVSAFTNLPAQIQAAFTAIVQFAENTWSTIVTDVQALRDSIVATFNDAVNTVTGYWTSFRDTVLGIFQSIKNGASDLASALGGGTPQNNGQGFARGGMVRGAGSATSDSIPARLSTGEFVQNARAVQYYGADVMAALNSLQAPFNLVRAAISGVNLGSLASSFMPRTHFADGGLVTAAASVGGGASSGRSFNIILGGETFANLTGPDHVLSSLEKAATRASIRGRTGRKPTWVK